MSTTFQPNAFQSDSFQIAGGVAATEFEVTISFTQDGDSHSLTLNLPSTSDATGGWPIEAMLSEMRRKKRREEERLREIEEQAEEANRRVVQAKSQEAKVKAKERLQKVIARQVEQERLLEALTAQIAAEMRLEAKRAQEEEDDAIAQLLLSM